MSQEARRAFREGCTDLSTKVLGLDLVPDDEAGRCGRDLEWASDILFGDKSYMVTSVCVRLRWGPDVGAGGLNGVAGVHAPSRIECPAARGG